MSHTRFNDDSDYDPTDSDEDYTENEKILLKKVRSKQSKDSDSEEEVFGVASDDSEQSDIALSDVEGQDDKDDLPDARAWGKKKNRFYNTDYVDPDYGGFQGKDAQLAELEEEEAKKLQKQLVEQLDDDDFCLDFTINKKVDEEKVEEVIKSDISKLSKRQQLEILRKESPEFFGLLDDFEKKMILAKDFLAPVIEKHKKGEIKESAATEFVTTFYHTILNYCINIKMYLLLKSSRVNLQHHPVIKRLYQYRQLLLKLEPIFEEQIKSQIELLLQGKGITEAPKSSKPKKKKLKENIKERVPSKKVKFEEEKSDSDEEKSDSDEEKKEISKRAITYQIAKNKGLTPHRKREQRNPRVKHRNKFRKAKIRRKGAVREPRTEKQRYGGEISGIKIGVTKSIKIK